MRSAVIVQIFRLVELVFQFALVLLAVRSMSSTAFGLASLGISVQAVAAIIGAFGYDELLQKSVATVPTPSQVPALLHQALRARLATSVAVALPLVIASQLMHSPFSFRTLLALGVAGVAQTVSNLYLSVAVSLRRVAVPFGASMMSWAAPTAICLIHPFSSVFSYVGSLAVGGILRVAISTAWFRSLGISAANTTPRNTRFLSDRIRDHASLAVYNLNNQVLARHGDVIIAGLLSISLGSIGLYAVMFQLSSTANTALMLGLGSVVLSRFSTIGNDPVRLGRAWRDVSRLANAVAIGPLMGLVLLSPEIADWTGGGQAEARRMLCALCVAQWLGRVTGGGTNIGALIASGLATYVARSSLLGAFVNILLDLALGSVWSINGIIVATAIAGALVGVSNTIKLSKLTGAMPPILQPALLTFLLVASVLLVWQGAGGITLEVRLIVGSALAVGWAFLVGKLRKVTL